jgi:hypothetical protein
MTKVDYTLLARAIADVQPTTRSNCPEASPDDTCADDFPQWVQWRRTVANVATVCAARCSGLPFNRQRFIRACAQRAQR